MDSGAYRDFFLVVFYRDYFADCAAQRCGRGNGPWGLCRLGRTAVGTGHFRSGDFRSFTDRDEYLFRIFLGLAHVGLG